MLVIGVRVGGGVSICGVAAFGVSAGAATLGDETSKGFARAFIDAYTSSYCRAKLSPVICCFRRSVALDRVLRRLEATERAEAVDRVLSCRFGAEAGRVGGRAGVGDRRASTSSTSLCSVVGLPSASWFRRSTSERSARHRRGAGDSGGGDDIGLCFSSNRSVQAS